MVYFYELIFRAVGVIRGKSTLRWYRGKKTSTVITKKLVPARDTARNIWSKIFRVPPSTAELLEDTDMHSTQCAGILKIGTAVPLRHTSPPTILPGPNLACHPPPPPFLKWPLPTNRPSSALPVADRRPLNHPINHRLTLSGSISFPSVLSSLPIHDILIEARLTFFWL